MSRFTLVVLALVFCLILSSSASAFDGDRRGFVLGSATGISAYMSTKSEGPINTIGRDISKETGGAFSLGYLGLGFSERDLLVGLAANSGYVNKALDISHSYVGVGWFHYFKETRGGMFTLLSLGVEHFDTGATDPTDPGFGYLVAGGWEFSWHWHVGAGVMAGKPREDAVDIDQIDVVVFIGGVLF